MTGLNSWQLREAHAYISYSEPSRIHLTILSNFIIRKNDFTARIAQTDKIYSESIHFYTQTQPETVQRTNWCFDMVYWIVWWCVIQ